MTRISDIIACMRFVVAFACCAACWSKPPPPITSISGQLDASNNHPIDAESTQRCAQWGEFATPVAFDAFFDPSDGTTEPVLSKDGLEMIFVKSNYLLERVRGAGSIDWSQAQTTNVFAGPPYDGPWLSADRKTLYYVKALDLYRAIRFTTTEPFPAGNLLINGAGPATTYDDHTIIFQKVEGSHLALDFAMIDDNGAVLSTGIVTSDTAHDQGSPAIGDHGRRIVWSVGGVGVTASLWEAELVGTTLVNPYDIGLNTTQMYRDSGAFLSDDGKTLIYTSERPTIDNPQIYSAHRTCNLYE